MGASRIAQGGSKSARGARISVCALGLGESKIARAVIKLGGSKFAIKQGGSVMKLGGSVCIVAGRNVGSSL